ncbi:Abscisic acid G-protein coupled receptor-domain-containing protein [Pseudoneurospora amorphoporcata]|uniref:Abscisic acid G-protein coupled receptor-domain-containing protein n=1 Tax=Pseudoneurospora amorphoporcata TaxID=241081 RepID=A0AAN6P0H4_9PEZI|nr:Abscisic acid G-protein coupled receptor-domain-containing protein [Pseudoneurospora amorphoporcata]
MSCGVDSCGAPIPASPISILFSLSPFIATFAIVSSVVAGKVFPRLSRVQDDRDDGEGHYLPPSAPPSLQQAHAERGARSMRRRVAAMTFSATIGLASVLGELILAEISDLVSPEARAIALRFTVPTLLFMLVVLIPFLELQSIVSSLATFQRTAKGRVPRIAWMLQLLGFGGWLFVFWSLGKAVPRPDGTEYLWGIASSDGAGFDSTALTIGRAEAKAESVGDVLVGGRLSRACLERIGVIGILLMALLSGFASVSSPWHTFADNRAFRKRPITDTDIARKQAGLDATSEMLATKRHRLRSLQDKVARRAEASASSHHHTGSNGSSLVGKMLGSLKGIATGSSAEAAEIKSLQMEISGLETMESNLSSSLSILRTRQAAHARDGTPLGRLLSLPSYIFSLYCIYRVLATTLTTLRRNNYSLFSLLFFSSSTLSESTGSSSTFSSTDPINRFLSLLAKHWDPKLDQVAWARQISFFLSGVILLGSANSVIVTFRIFAKWMPGLLYQAQANLALLTAQIAATYVISSALLLRSNLPREVGRSVGDALESALEPGFVDRWFDGWFLVASGLTALGIWVGRNMGAGTYNSPGGSGGWSGLDEWEEFGGEEMGVGAKRS